ncbi:MAG: hypothetical protein ACNA8K_05660 [Cyclonatronaceae bacterium]
MGLMNKFGYRSLVSLMVVASLLVSLNTTGKSSSDKIDVQMLVENSLNVARLLSLSQLSGSVNTDERFITLYLSNLTPERQNNLRLHINVRSTRYGVIVNLDERNGFGMEPGQSARANMSSLGDGIPGITSNMRFDAGLTAGGEAMINELRGSSTLPDDIYTITVEIYQNGNSASGVLVGGNSITIGAEPGISTFEVRPVQPGDVIGSGATIFNTNPVFSWEGDPSLRFRLVLVQAAVGRSAEALIQSALDTNPPAQGGRLLTGEIADVETGQLSYSYPTSGVKPLEPNTTYYWQVFALVPDVRGEQLLPSEIFEFTVSGDRSNQQAGVNREINTLVRKHFRRSDIISLSRDGYDLVSVEFKGTVYTGPQIITVLEDFFEKVDEGKIRMVE